MASEKQVAANRSNAIRSTGPRTLAGKIRSRSNAIKHGLTGRAVVGGFEDEAEFRSFCQQIAAGYAPRSSTDQEMVHRLASLLWRLRRAHAVETGLLSIQGKIQRDIRLTMEPDQQNMFRLFGLEQVLPTSADPALLAERQLTEAKARAFLRLCNINGGALDRLNRYEVTLWRQAAQVMMMLERVAEKSIP